MRVDASTQKRQLVGGQMIPEVCRRALVNDVFITFPRHLQPGVVDPANLEKHRVEF